MSGAAVRETGVRYDTLDHIRGLSILGILIVNAIAFAQPFDVYSDPTRSPIAMTSADTVMWWIIETFAHGKFITLFSLLFGVSVFLVGEGDDAVLRRRLMWLVAFGLIHGVLIWHGDILLLYACAGLIFQRWRNRSARWLCVTGLGLYVATALALIGLYSLSRLMPTGMEMPQRDPGFIDLMRSGFVGSLQGNVSQWSQDILAVLLIYLPHTVGLMMLGLGLFKAGFLKGQGRTGTYVAAMAAGAAGLLVSGILHARFATNGFNSAGFTFLYDSAELSLPLVVALGYAAGLILLTRYVGQGLLYPLACAGRLAFTNYISQSLIMTALFYGGRLPAGTEVFGYEVPLYGTMNHAGLMPFVAAIWAGQLVFSMLWLQIFRYGPFEWVWRSLSQRRPVRILR